LKRRALAVVWVVMTLSLAGCGSNETKPEAATTPREMNPAPEAAGATTATAVPSAADQETGGPMAGQLAVRVVYFDFDSAEIKGVGVEVIATHAKYLAANPTARVRLEGNTDERGSREYNIGLGERRAQSVRRAMLLQGAADGQITTVSYGEEHPVANGHDEAAWAKNRRVDIVYLVSLSPPPKP